MKIVGVLVRIFSYLFHFLLALFVFAVSVVTLLGGQHNLDLDMLPWEGRSLTYWLLVSGLFGLAAVLLAVRGALRIVFLLWSLGVAVMLLRGYLWTSYRFDPDNLWQPVLLMLASVLAVAGAWSAFWQKPARG